MAIIFKGISTSIIALHVHLPIERIENAIIISCDFDVITSLGLLGCAERVSKPSAIRRERTFLEETLLVKNRNCIHD